MDNNLVLRDIRDAATAHPHHTLVFSAPDGQIPAGFHLTEFKHNRVDSIDCGGEVNQWQEAAVELLGDTSGAAMSGAALSGILDKTETALPGISALPLFIEYAPLDQTVQRFELAGIQTRDDTLIMTLQKTAGQCKALTRAKATSGACCAPSCCG